MAVTCGHCGKYLQLEPEGFYTGCEHCPPMVTDMIPEVKRLTTENKRLRKALEDIRTHQAMVAGSARKYSLTWNIANTALET